MDPLLIDVPEQIHTEHLLLRSPRKGDGPKINAAICASIDELRPWMPWAQTAPTVDESEAYCRRMTASWALRQDLPMFIIERLSNGEEGEFVGATGLHRINWDVRSFEIGYWRRTGHAGRGVVTEATRAVAGLAFTALAAQRVEIRMDENNRASRRVAERAGFTFEGLLRCDTLTPSGQVRHTRVYSRVRGIEEPG
jgi:RimJ/RimL family protein N-acetyltransferase